MYKKILEKVSNFISRLLKWKPKLVDINAKLLETNIKKVNIEVTKEKNIVKIGALDDSKHIHFYNEIGLPPEVVLSLPPEDVGNFIKHKTILTIKAAFKDNPDEMNKYLATYNPMIMVTGASGVVTQNLAKIYETEGPYPSGDFVKELPGAINSTGIDFIKVGEDVNMGIIDISPKETNT